MNQVLFSKKSDNYRTPKELYNYFMDHHFYDPCPFQCDEDNLEKVYCHSLFINPPYSAIDKWVDFAIRNLNDDNVVALLIPSRTDTKYFHKLLQCDGFKSYFLFFKGRLKFDNGSCKGSAPFPSVLILLKKVSRFPDERSYIGEFSFDLVDSLLDYLDFSYCLC